MVESCWGEKRSSQLHITRGHEEEASLLSLSACSWNRQEFALVCTECVCVCAVQYMYGIEMGTRMTTAIAERSLRWIMYERRSHVRMHHNKIELEGAVHPFVARRWPN